jgi:hypothetical protein
VSQRRREYIDELVTLLPLHPITLQTAYLVGQIEGREAARGTCCRSTICSSPRLPSSVLTENLRHFEKIPGVQILKL